MRITNVDAISALFDRLITEKIKFYFFEKQNKKDEAKHQRKVIDEIKIKLEELLFETYKSKNYDYVGEKRTFDEAKLIDDVETLIQNDLDVGDAYYTKTEGEPTLEKFMVNESRLRTANESRGRMKNRIDESFKNIVERDDK
jgi:spore germination cell wall hydrolase CwlJ-like protein